jgi:hypothetical protein
MSEIEHLRMVVDQAVNKLAKWRSIFAGWQLGTRPDTDPECRAVRDQRELLMLLRVEASAMAGLLVRKGIITEKEWLEAVATEAGLMDKDMEKRFPGMRSSQSGITIFDVKLAAETTKEWKP